MLKRLSFAAQVMVLPIVAGLAFVVLAAVSVVLGWQSEYALERIEKYYEPAVKTSQEMQRILSKLQRGLQDSVVALDEDLLNETAVLQKEFLKLVASAKQNPVNESKEILELERAFEKYFSVAVQTSRKMILGQDSEDLNQSVGAMRESYLNIKGMVGRYVDTTNTRNQKFLVGIAKDASLKPLYISIPLIITAFLIVVFLARYISSGTVRSLRDASSALVAASSELAFLAEETESKITDKASSVGETRSSMAQMLSDADKVGRSASSVAESANRSTTASQTISERISELSGQALQISNISETVQRIAEKSNVLALNATLEGAKAGEAGLGFAIVGQEMRSLSETIKDAAREIKQLVKQIQNLSYSAVSASEDGKNLANENLESARSIVHIITQQRKAAEHVDQAMDRIQEYTSQAVAGARQSKNTAKDLVLTANTLEALVKGRDDGA